MTDVTAPLPGVETHPGSGHYAVYEDMFDEPKKA